MSTYGNVPADDIDAVRNAARVANLVTMNLPGLAPQDWRETAYETVLDGILTDWVANGTTELDANDEQIPLAARQAQVAQVSNVQHVKDAVGEHNARTALPSVRQASLKRYQIEDGSRHSAY